MANQLIKPFNEDFADYLRDESRITGQADSISFPKNKQELIGILQELAGTNTPITVQGGRTGLAAAAVPFGGHALNFMRMDAVTGLRKDQSGRYYVRVQPGVVLSKLRKMLESRKFEAAHLQSWDQSSLAALTEFARAPEQFFSPDPTEASATIGGMIACNASGARSYLYGPVRPYITQLKLALADGDTLTMCRGQYHAKGRKLTLTTDSGRVICCDLPSYEMPKTKNASGYYIEDNMDAIDLFIGSDGTLAIIYEAELALLPLPARIWGVSCFFTQESQAIALVELVREQLDRIAAIEFFDRDALAILRRQKEESTAFAALPAVMPGMEAAIYLEIHAEDEKIAYERLFALGKLIGAVGGREDDTWVARTAADRDRLVFFRHAVPESVNMLIDQRKKTEPTITKLGTDMSAPDSELSNIMTMYRQMLMEKGLESAIWGHIGDNHLHVNILPRNAADQLTGKELYQQWAERISALGGAVSAEHGVGKLKVSFLETMYGSDHIAEMAAMKKNFDPQYQLGRDNLF
ncbi:MAG: FAD-binding oxidoreductase, partial [Clostridiales bacterium]